MLEWVDWFNNKRLLGPIGDIPPVEFEQLYYSREGAPTMEAGPNQDGRRNTRGDSVCSHTTAGEGACVADEGNGVSWRARSWAGLWAGCAGGALIGLLDGGQVLFSTGAWWFQLSDVLVAIGSYGVAGTLFGAAAGVLLPLPSAWLLFRIVLGAVAGGGVAAVASFHAFDVVIPPGSRSEIGRYLAASAPFVAGVVALCLLLTFAGRRNPNGLSCARVALSVVALSVLVLGGARTLVGSGAPPSSVSARENAPDVVLLVMDTTRSDNLSVYGNKGIQTAGLQRIADEGLVYDRAYSPGTWTSVAHASMFTGTYASIHGTYGLRTDLTSELPTLAEAMREAGYQTSFVAMKDLMSRTKGWTRGFQESVTVNRDDRVSLVWRRFLETTTSMIEDLTRTQVQMTLQWMEHAQQNPEPFFMFLNVNDPHKSYLRREPFYSRYLAEADLSDADVALGDRLGKELHAFQESVAEPGSRALHVLYNSEVSAMDVELSRLFDWLRDQHRDRPVVLLVVADHGELLGEHDRVGHGMRPYQELINVPFILWSKPSLGSGRSAELVSLVDVFPTLIGLAGGDRSQYPEIKGRDIFSDPEPSVVFSEHWNKPEQISEAEGLRKAVISRDAKFIWERNAENLLFDLAEDPGERTNLAASHPEEASRWEGVLRSNFDLDEELKSFELDEEERRRLEAVGYLR